MKQMTSFLRKIAILRKIAMTLASQLVLASPAGAASPVDPSGTWLTEDGRARIRIERCGPVLEQVCGYIVWMKDPADASGQPFRDQSNPDPAKRGRPVLGHQLILGLTPSAAARFDGRIYDAESGKSYDISLWRETADKLKVKGCMLSILCATQTWAQTVNALPGQLIGMTGDPNGPKADREWAPQARLPTVARAAR